MKAKILWIGEEQISCYFKGDIKVESTVVFGFFDSNTNEIHIDNVQCKAVQARALFHEMMHAVIALRIGKQAWSQPVDQMEEGYVRVLESVLDVLKDRRNRWFVTFTTGGAL